MKILGMLALAATFLLTACGQELEPIEAHALLVNSVVELQQDNGRTVCTATQIGPTAYLTAGHCFDIGKVTQIQKRDQVRQIVFSNYQFRSGEDWGVFYTDEPIDHTQSLPLACTEEVYTTMPIATLGHPSPFLFDFITGRVTGENIRTREGRQPGSDFFSDVMTGGGASGSAVISMNTGSIIGVLVEGFFNSHRTQFRMGFQSLEPICEYLNNIKVPNDQE